MRQDQLTEHEHVDGPRSECPGCIAADELRAQVITAARAQLGRPAKGSLTGPNGARHLANLVLRMLGESR